MISPTISDKTAAGSAVTCRTGGFFLRRVGLWGGGKSE